VTVSLALTHDQPEQRLHAAAGHPERPDRVDAILEQIRADPQLTALPVLEWDVPGPQTALLVHSAEHVARIEAYVRAGGGWFDADTYCTGDSLTVALAAIGSSLRAVDAVLAGEARSAFVVSRPPGHHATRNRAMGFCLFNNIAIAAVHARRNGISRIAVIDIDVHHGNGTQDIFYDDASLLYCSLHQFPWYPGTGSADERGGSEALNTTVNVPVPAGTGGEEWLELFDRHVAPAVEGFAPELLLVSAGFDAHEADPLAQLRLTEETYAATAQRIRALASQHAGGRSVWMLEGGYDLEALSGSVVACLRVLAAA
jgi:acetoin utilization deacetylase AcuC-like enzyme